MKINIKKIKYNFNTFNVVFFMEFSRIKNEPIRLLSSIVQSLMFWFIIGSGFLSSFKINESSSLDYLNFFYPGILIMNILFNSISSTMTIIEDKKFGFLQCILVGPGSRFSFVLGKIFSITMISIIQVLFFLILAPFMSINLEQAIWIEVFFVIFLGALSLSSIGFILAWISETTTTYHSLMSIILIPLWILSGAMFPVKDGWISKIALFNPISWIISALRASLNGGIAHVGTINLYLDFKNSFSLIFIFSFFMLFFAFIISTLKR